MSERLGRALGRWNEPSWPWNGGHHAPLLPKPTQLYRCRREPSCVKFKKKKINRKEGILTMFQTHNRTSLKGVGERL